MTNKTIPKRISHAGLGMGEELFFGGLLGPLTGNLIIFAGEGMILGLCISITPNSDGNCINL